jgi:hypothetical protein
METSIAERCKIAASRRTPNRRQILAIGLPVRSRPPEIRRAARSGTGWRRNRRTKPIATSAEATS